MTIADKDARTYGEEQTAVHYAAKNDALDSLKMLVKIGCDIEVRDSKQRTPLQAASELGLLLYSIAAFLRFPVILVIMSPNKLQTRV